MGPIKASYRWTKEEQLRANSHATRHTPVARWGMLAIKALGVSFWGSGVFRLCTNHPDRSGAVALVILGVFVFVIPYLQQFAALMRQRRAPMQGKTVHWEIDGEGITVDTELSKANFKWGALFKIIRVNDGFLLATQAGFFHWLPSNAFDEAADVERFADFAKANVRRYLDQS